MSATCDLDTQEQRSPFSGSTGRPKLRTETDFDTIVAPSVVVQGVEAKRPTEASPNPGSLSAAIVGELRRHPRLCIACFAMIAMGIAMGMLIETWSFLTSVYVIVQIITTIGYGDVTVDKEWMQFFMTIYVLLSLVIVAQFLNMLVSVTMDIQISTIRQKLRKIEVAGLKRITTESEARKAFGDFNAVVVPSVLLFCSIASGTLFYRLAEHCTCSYGATLKEDCNDESYSTCIETGGFGHTWISSFYMSVITVTTVGFGDYSPKTPLGRIFGIVWMFTGVAFTGLFITAVSTLFTKRARDEFESAADIDRALFNQMDKDCNGYLTKAEYTRYVLVKHGLIPEEIVQDIDAKYEAMDTASSGMLTFDMVQAVARHAQEDEAKDVPFADLVHSDVFRV